MTIIGAVDTQVDSPQTYRYLPEPETSANFETVKTAIQGIANVVTSVTSQAGSILGGAGAEIGGQYQDMINLQLEAQKQMMLVSMVSNIEKSKHETQMAAVRNIRVG